MPRPLTILMLLLAACASRRVDNPYEGEGVLSCEAIAMEGPNGQPDPCDVQACQACVDFCGLDCAILESAPPQYSCPGIGSYTSLDFCPAPASPTDDAP